MWAVHCTPPAATGGYAVLCSYLDRRFRFVYHGSSIPSGVVLKKWYTGLFMQHQFYCSITTELLLPSGTSTSPVTVLLPQPQIEARHRLELRKTVHCGFRSPDNTLHWMRAHLCRWIQLSSPIPSGTYNPIVLDVRPHNPANGALAIQSYSYWYSDDWSWVAIPQCETPLNVANTAATASTLDFNWTHSGGNAQSFNIEYGPSGFTQGTGTTMTTTGASVQLTGLAANTLYDVYVQADCGGSGISGWSNPGTARTSCNTVAMPYLEGFDGVSPVCWNIDGTNS